MTSARGAASSACVTEAAMAPTQVEKERKQNVGYAAEMKYIFVFVFFLIKKREFGTFRESGRDGDGGLEVDGETVNHR